MFVETIFQLWDRYTNIRHTAVESFVQVVPTLVSTVTSVIAHDTLPGATTVEGIIGAARVCTYNMLITTDELNRIINIIPH